MKAGWERVSRQCVKLRAPSFNRQVTMGQVLHLLHVMPNRAMPSPHDYCTQHDLIGMGEKVPLPPLPLCHIVKHNSLGNTSSAPTLLAKASLGTEVGVLFFFTRYPPQGVAQLPKATRTKSGFGSPSGAMTKCCCQNGKTQRSFQVDSL